MRFTPLKPSRPDANVYVEKPFANTMDDANLALERIAASDRVLQVGTQRRSASNYIAANEYIRSGKFGDIVAAHMTWNCEPARAGWRRPDLVASIKESDTDWTRYLINRPHEAWDPRKYLEYRLFWPYSSGIPGQWMVHQIDTVHWFSGLPYPRSVVANGGIYLWKDGRKNFDTMTAVYDYGPLDATTGGFQVVYSSRQTNAAGRIRELYYSNGGTLNLDTNTVSPEGGLTKRHAVAMGMQPFQLNEMKLDEVGGVATAANTGGDNATMAHMRNWMECVRSRETPNADIHAAWNHSVALCMTIAALHTGKADHLRYAENGCRGELNNGFHGCNRHPAAFAQTTLFGVERMVRSCGADLRGGRFPRPHIWAGPRCAAGSCGPGSGGAARGCAGRWRGIHRVPCTRTRFPCLKSRCCIRCGRHRALP